jgi:hypothetical protein
MIIDIFDNFKYFGIEEIEFKNEIEKNKNQQDIHHIPDTFLNLKDLF